MFFYFYISFIFFVLISVSMPFSSISTASICSRKCMPLLALSFFKALYFSFVFSAEKAFNSGITTDCYFFSIKLIWSNPKLDLNLIVFRSDNLDCIIIGIKISSWTYIKCLLHLINFALSILYFLICCFVRSLMF